MSISKHIKFNSACKVDNLNNSHPIKHIKAVIVAYVTRGFCVTIILADNQFEPMRGDLTNLHTILHTALRDEHVPEVEWFNRTIKEHVCDNCIMFPFQRLFPVFFIKMMDNAVFWRNMLALKGGVSKT